VLIRPENIDKIPPKFKTKIEQIARKPVKQEDPAEPLAPCPFCRFQIPETRLDCPSCKRNIPFCCASGKHMVLTEWSSCPQCQMVCNYSEMKRVLEADPVCPICDKQVMPMSVTISSNAEQEFKSLVELMKDSGPSAEE
jgi:WD repeat-containing protein 19